MKLYQTYVLIEDEAEGLKPDMTAEVTIHVDAAKEQVLAVPLQAVIGGAELGVKREVFVRTPTGYDKREVTLGLYNEKMVEVRDGLHDGDEVVINPKVLLGDAKTKTRDGSGEGTPSVWLSMKACTSSICAAVVFVETLNRIVRTSEMTVFEAGTQLSAGAAGSGVDDSDGVADGGDVGVAEGVGEGLVQLRKETLSVA